MNTLTQQINQAVTLEPKARLKALKAIKWRLYCPQLNLWAGLDEQGNIIPCHSKDDPRIQVFDGRDNEAQKLAFYTHFTGIKWEVRCES